MMEKDLITLAVVENWKDTVHDSYRWWNNANNSWRVVM